MIYIAPSKIENTVIWGITYYYFRRTSNHFIRLLNWIRQKESFGTMNWIDFFLDWNELESSTDTTTGKTVGHSNNDTNSLVIS